MSETRYRCCEHCPKGPHVDHERPCRVGCSGSVKLPSKAPSSPLETTAGSGQCPEQPPTNESPHLAAKYWRERQSLRDEVAILIHVVQGHDRERQGLKAAIAQRDATIERLWAQLNEATNVPDHQCSLNDPECDGTDLSTLAQHAQTQAADTDLPDAERALWWQIAEDVIDYLEPTEVMVGEVTLEAGLFEATS